MDEISKANIARLGENDGQFVAKMLKEADAMEITLRPWKNNIVKYYELYKMYQRMKHYDGLAQLFVPEILRAVETVVSTMYKALTSSDPIVEYEARVESDEDEAAAARAETQLVSFQLEENNFKMKIQDSLRQMALTGLTVRKVLWDFDQLPKKQRKYHYETSVDPITNKQSKTKVVDTIDEYETVRDHWTVEPVDLLGFYISDVATPYYDIRKADWLAEEYKVKISWLKKNLKKNWLADNKFDDIHEQGQDLNSEAQRFKNDLLQVSGYKNSIPANGILIYERWGLMEAKYVYDSKQLEENQLEPDDLVETVCLIANRKWLIKLAPNPFWHGKKPYVSCPYVPQENEFAGIGISQIGQTLQEELNDTRNQTMDNKTLILMNMWLKNRASGIKNQDLRVRPLGVIPTNDMNGLQALRPPVLTGVGVNIEGVVKNDLRESVGAPSNLQGIAQSGVSTATESTEINMQAMGRIGLTTALFAELVMKPIFYFADELNAQFYNQEKVIKVVGEGGVKWVKRHPDDIISNTKKDVVIKLSTDADGSPTVKRQQLLQFMTILQNIPPQLIPQYWKILDQIYKSFFPSGHDLSDIFPAPPGDEPLLDPREELHVMLMGRPVKVKQGDDDVQHIQEHEADQKALQMAMSPLAFKLHTDHILAHHKQLAAKIEAQRQQQEAQTAMQAEAQSKGKQMAGQTSGMSAFTQPNVKKAGDITRNVGA